MSENSGFGETAHVYAEAERDDELSLDDQASVEVDPEPEGQDE